MLIGRMHFDKSRELGIKGMSEGGKGNWGGVQGRVEEAKGIRMDYGEEWRRRSK